MCSDICDRAERDRFAALARLAAAPLVGTEWSPPRCAFFGAVVPGQEKAYRVV